MDPILSVTSDYFKSTGCPEPYLRRIAEAGFTHVHWCHHWFTDFLYSRHEIEQIACWMDEFGLAILNIHASQGQEKNWGSLREYERLSGVELVYNRIEMAGRMGSDVIILHIPPPPDGGDSSKSIFVDQLYRSMDEIADFARRKGVRVALENMAGDDYLMIDDLLSHYGPDVLGFCYDSGHGNIGTNGLGQLEVRKDRLIAIHLHDNDGKDDLHNIPYTGTVDWEHLIRILKASPYPGAINLEVVTKVPGLDSERDFLRKAFEVSQTLARQLST